MIQEDEEEYEDGFEEEKDANNDVEMRDSADVPSQSNDGRNADTTLGHEIDMDVDSTPKTNKSAQTGFQQRSRRSRGNHDPEWTLQTALGTEEEQKRWKSGEIAGVYEDALRMLLRLQGEDNAITEAGGEGNALATTVGKAERAGRAAEVVNNMDK